MQLFYQTIETPFQYPFQISKGRLKTHQPALVVALGLGKMFGYGEAPAIQYYDISIGKLVEQLEAIKKDIEKYAFNDAYRFGHFLEHLIPKQHFLRCALDMAGWDLYGKLQQTPLYTLWGTHWDINSIPYTDYTIGIDEPDMMLKKMLAYPSPIYKIKSKSTADIEIFKYLRKHTKAIFRVDANESWTANETLQLVPTLCDVGVELVEQPLEKNNFEGMKTLMQQNDLLFIADESCVSASDVEKCKYHFHGINIKLTKCGGITSALQMIPKAKLLGLKVMMGSMNETTVGTAAIAHFAPQLDFLDADGPLLLNEDIATGLQYKQGKVEVSHKPGLGISFNA